MPSKKKKTSLIEPEFVTPKVKTIDDKTYEEFKKEAKQQQIGITGQDNVVIRMPKHVCGVVWMPDIHLGGEYMNRQKWFDDEDIIHDTPHCYVVKGGDMLDNFTKSGHGGGSYEEDMPIPEQRACMKKVIERNGNKTLGILQGNHEEWSYDADSFDAASYFAHHIKGYWLGMGGIITLQFPRWNRRIYVVHKTERHSPQDPVYGLRFAYFAAENFDIGFSGHWHQASISVEYVRGKQVIFATGGSYKPTDRYTASLGIRKGQVLMPGILFDPIKKITQPFLNFRDMLPYLK